MALHFSVYCHSPEKLDRLRQVIEASGVGMLVAANDLTHLPPVGENGTDVLLLEYQENNPQLDRWIETTATNPKNPAVFLVFPEISASQLWKALHLGVKECFAFPVGPEEFKAAVDRFLTHTALKPPLEGPGRIISLLGCKGGVGTSFLASNLAYLISREQKGQVLLVDLDLQYAQLVHFFDIKARHSLSDLIAHLEEMDHSYLQNVVYPYNKCLAILPGPANLEEAEAITAEHLGKILSYLKNMQVFRWILLDAGHRMEEITLKALELSDHLVLVTVPSVPALANTRKWLGLLHLLDLEVPVEIWLNAWDKNTPLALSEVSDYLGAEVYATLPGDADAVNRSINDGRPLTETDPRHPLCQALQTRADRLMGKENPAGAMTPGWGWLKRLTGKAA
jgi:pilus assembly protein CpaE